MTTRRLKLPKTKPADDHDQSKSVMDMKGLDIWTQPSFCRPSFQPFFPRDG